MDTPVRKYQKQKDYQRHKLFRKMKRRRKAAIEQAKDAPMKPLRRKFKMPKFEGGKDDKPNVFQLADGTTENSQQMNRPNIYRYNDGRYVYQAAPDAEEIEVSPINTLLPNPSQWTYQDASGKIYTPHATQVDTGSITQNEDTNPLMRAANNYVRELSWRAQNDPSSIALQGKYTLPAALSPLLAPIGEAAYPYVSAALANPYVDAGLTSAFAGHGLNHAINEGIDGWGDAAMTALELAPLGRLAKPLYESTSNIINSAYNKLPWTYKIPENPNMAYRRMGPLERDWLMEGNELSTRETNALTEAEEEAAKLDPKYTTQSGLRFNFFKAGAEHGGRKQFAKGQPWKGTTVTHGEEQVLAIPGKDLPWVSGRHFHGPQGNGFRVGDISFEEAPFGSHIDLLTNEGYSGVNPSLLDGSVIYSPYKIFGRNFGYKKLYPTNTSTPRGLLSNKPLVAKGIPQITAENAAGITPEQWTADDLFSLPGANLKEKEIISYLENAEPVPRDILRRPLSSLDEDGKVQWSAANGINDAVKFLRSEGYKTRLKNLGYTSDEANYIVDSQIDNIRKGDVVTLPKYNKMYSRHGMATPYRREDGTMGYQIALQPEKSLGYNPRVTAAHEAFHVGSNQHGIKDFASLPQDIREHNASIRPIVNDDYDAKLVFERLTDEELRARALEVLARSERANMPVMDYINKWGADPIPGKGPGILRNPNYDHNANDLRTYFTPESLKRYLEGVAGIAAPLAGGTALFGYNSLGQPADTYKHGKDSGIHINPKNRGKFTALKKRTGKTTEQLTHSKNPLTRKRAIFAQNAKKWKH